MQPTKTTTENPPSRDLKLKEYRVICFLPTTVEFSALEEYRRKMVSLVEDELSGYVRKAAKFKQHLVETAKNKGNRSTQVILLQIFIEPYQVKAIEKHILLLKETISNFMILKESDFLSEEELAQRKEKEQNRRELYRERNKETPNSSY